MRIRGTLSEVPGVLVGHQSLGDSGCTVVLTPAGAVASVDVRGGGPGTRETDLLEPHNTVERIHGISFSGGSAFGLAAASGVMEVLEESGIGFPVLGEGVPGPIVPIVPGAVIFDLLVGDPGNRPTAADGATATRAALAGTSRESGSVGAGCGATAGPLRGGFGQSSQMVGEWVIAAGVVANPVGHVVDPQTGTLWGDASGGLAAIDPEVYAAIPPLATKLNTTIGVIATNAPITKAQAKRLAMVGHDGIAVAVRPAHSPLDGDTLFCVSTGEGTGVSLPVMIELSRAATQVVTDAIVDAVTTASPDTTGTFQPAWQALLGE